MYTFHIWVCVKMINPPKNGYLNILSVLPPGAPLVDCTSALGTLSIRSKAMTKESYACAGRHGGSAGGNFSI